MWDIFWQETNSCGRVKAMIAFLEGSILSLRSDTVVLLTGGIGYRVHVTSFTLGKISGEASIRLHIHTHVREDAITLFGFLTEEELSMFELLISVSGVGPKMALGILSVAEPASIRAAVVGKDIAILTRISGVGKRTAERILLDLENKVGSISDSLVQSATEESEAVDALSSLGYSASEIREAMKHIPPGMKRVEDRVGALLKMLGRKK
ncbi:MAG: Holliday junction branch migration protein RuvA [Candidatus Moraniibacteriota bacterium]|nr:MAG: Holliday junction branch migration protein RuvA [Candidatus Moranbacteria bacterium]